MEGEHTAALNDAPKSTADADGLNEQSIARGTNLWARFVYEWKFENLWFSGDYPKTYGKLHWTRAFGTAGSGCWCCSRARGDERNATYQMMSPLKWIFWRVIVCAYITAILVYSMVTSWFDGTWYFYLTNWQTTIFTMYGWFSLASAIYIYVYYRDTLEGDFAESAKKIGGIQRGSHVEYKIPLLVKTTWVLQGLAMSLGIWVTIMFWIVAAAFGYYDPPRLPYALLDHFSTMFIVLLDFSFASFPWLLFQWVWSSFLALAFVIWSVIHYEAGLTNRFDGGHYLYRGLEWEFPVRTFFVVFTLIMVGIPLASISVWALSSEAMGKCAPRRLVPWIDPDGAGGHRLISYKGNLLSKRTVVSNHAVVDENHQSSQQSAHDV